MPIKAAQSGLEQQLKSAFSLGEGANAASSAALIGMAVAAAAAQGLVPAAPSPIPLVPAGVGACIAMLAGTFLSFPPEVPAAASQIATAISVVAPMCPPAGLSNLQSALGASMSVDGGNSLEASAADWASAIIAYYQAGGII